MTESFKHNIAWRKRSCKQEDDHSILFKNIFIHPIFRKIFNTFFSFKILFVQYFCSSIFLTYCNGIAPNIIWWENDSINWQRLFLFSFLVVLMVDTLALFSSNQQLFVLIPISLIWIHLGHGIFCCKYDLRWVNFPSIFGQDFILYE